MAELQKMKSYQQLTRSFLKLVKFAKTKQKKLLRLQYQSRPTNTNLNFKLMIRVCF